MVYLQIYINISCICKNQTATHFKFGQQLLGISQVQVRQYEFQSRLNVLNNKLLTQKKDLPAYRMSKPHLLSPHPSVQSGIREETVSQSGTVGPVIEEHITKQSNIYERSSSHFSCFVSQHYSTQNLKILTNNLR